MSTTTSSKLLTAGKILLILVALDLFFVSIQLLSAFKGMGSDYAPGLIRQLGHNPMIGLMLGVLVTSIMQSSSMTTSIVVSLSATGFFGEDPIQILRIAVPLIMGANIGTSITNILVSLAQVDQKAEFERAVSCAIVHDFFNVLAVIILLPLQATTNFLGHVSLFSASLFKSIGGLHFTSPIKFLASPQSSLVKLAFENPDLVYFVIVLSGFVLLFVSIRIIAKRCGEDKSNFWSIVTIALLWALVMTLVHHYHSFVFSKETAVFLMGLGILFASLTIFTRVIRSMVLNQLESLFHNYVFKTAGRALAVGIFVTAIVQSSSVTTSMVVPLAGAGILTIYQIFPYTLGANVGTTITALLAALSLGEAVGVAVAFAHLFFNVLGILIIYPIRRLPIRAAQKFAELSMRSALIPVLYILVVFICVPLAFIGVFR